MGVRIVGSNEIKLLLLSFNFLPKKNFYTCVTSAGPAQPLYVHRPKF